MKKSERIDLRLTPEEKNLLETQAREHGMNHSQYICFLLKRVAVPKNHEQKIKDSLAENHILNSLLANPNLGKNAKQLDRKSVV